MTDRELLELAAKAAGFIVMLDFQDTRDSAGYGDKGLYLAQNTCWNSLESDADALNLAIILRMTITNYSEHESEVGYGNGRWVSVPSRINRSASTRRAITLAAAEIGKRMP